MSCAIHWFRRDLRLADNPALVSALEQGLPVVPVFVHAPEEEAPWAPGGASRWWLHHSLAALAQSLEAMGSRLVVRRGPTLQTMLALVAETGAKAVFWNRLYEPATIARDTRIKAALREHGIEAQSRNAALLYEPWDVVKNDGTAYQVFTPFWKACRAKFDPMAPVPAPKNVPAPPEWPASLAVGELGLLPKINWTAGMHEMWTPGEMGAQKRLKRFLAGTVADYHDRRDRPDMEGTSCLSPHLHFGEIGPRQAWHATRAAGDLGKGGQKFLDEIGWREFAHHLLFHFPHTPTEPLRENFRSFPWLRNEKVLDDWRRGRTGYPIIDAGMRELWHTGWMHNRVRMIVASFLVKDLLHSWSEGAEWFWDTLVDADLASNTLGWQWAGGCGADAAPYFRVFNPTLQGAKFDPDGKYVRRWVPELAKLTNRYIHCPWDAPQAELRAANVAFEKTYPERIVDHDEARLRALQAFERVKRAVG